MSVLPVGIGSSGGYTISRSVRLRQSASAYFSRTNTNAPTNAKIGTLSMWVKRGSLATGNSQYLIETGTGASNNTYFTLFFDTSNNINSGQYSETPFTNTSVVFRDPSAWYHIVITYDSTQAIAANRFKLYVNNQLLTSSTTITQNNEWAILKASQLINIGRHTSVARHFDGYLTEINLIDGQALAPSSFGETDTITGVWKPKKYTGTYGTNGFYLNFSDNSATTATTIGKDYSGNGNNWTPNNISITAGATYDSMLDVPTPYDDGGNGRGNYATWNPLFIPATNSKAVLTNGNLTATATATANFFAISSIGVKAGKWYCEFTLGANSAVNAYPYFGVEAFSTMTTGSAPGGSANGVAYNQSGQKYTNNTASSYGTAWSNGDVIGLAFDLDSAQRTATFYRNGTSQGSINFNTTTEEMVVGLGLNGSGETGSINFGQRPFSYTPPTGFKALNTQNLSDATIKNGNQYFDATTYTGNGTSQSIVNSGAMQPDLVWLKNRSAVASHALLDAVRGTNSYLYSDLTNAEGSGESFSSFNSNGFSLSGSNVRQNANSNTYVGWQWNAGGSTVTNTSGSISSQVRANPSAGFSIVTYTGTGTTGATVGHGLGAVPQMIIVKNRTTASHWPVGHVSLPSWAYNVYLSLTNAQAVVNTSFNSTTPTSTVFTLGPSGNETNSSGNNFVAYCFTGIAGYSKFGSYTGNGSADGPFVFCGFRPRYVLIKRTDAAGNWNDFDTARNIYNGMNNLLLLNTSAAEVAGGVVLDCVSNGFKLRDTSANWNASGGTFIFMAFAENPFKHSLAR